MNVHQERAPHCAVVRGGRRGLRGWNSETSFFLKQAKCILTRVLIYIPVLGICPLLLRLSSKALGKVLFEQSCPTLLPSVIKRSPPPPWFPSSP
ncbi:hypothetical protein JZ751_028972, partial [Albula glossodonta]